MNSNSIKTTKTHQIEPTENKMENNVQNDDPTDPYYFATKQKCSKCQHLGTAVYLFDFRKFNSNLFFLKVFLFVNIRLRLEIICTISMQKKGVTIFQENRSDPKTAIQL